MDWELQVISAATLIAIVCGGVTMGVYLAFVTKCGFVPSLVTLIVVGWSFIIPLSITQIATTGEMNVGRMFERMFLWGLFALHARLGTKLVGHWRATRTE